MLVGLGANIGDPIGQLRVAVRRIRDLVHLDAVSAVYRTDPVGPLRQPRFYNLVASGRTDAMPLDLLSAAARIEAELGRTRGVVDGPRTIDVDILAFDRLVIESPRLTLPHPRMHERAFVLVPLAEIEPAWRHPVSGLTAEELLARVGGRCGVERLGGLPDETGID